MQVPFCSLKSISVLDILKCTDAIGIPNPYFTDYSNKSFLSIVDNNGCLSLSQPSITYNKQLVRMTLDNGEGSLPLKFKFKKPYESNYKTISTKKVTNNGTETIVDKPFNLEINVSEENLFGKVTNTPDPIVLIYRLSQAYEILLLIKALDINKSEIENVKNIEEILNIIKNKIGSKVDLNDYLMYINSIDYYYNKDNDDGDSIIHVLNKDLTKYFKTNKDNKYKSFLTKRCSLPIRKWDYKESIYYSFKFRILSSSKYKTSLGFVHITGEVLDNNLNKSFNGKFYIRFNFDSRSYSGKAVTNNFIIDLDYAGWKETETSKVFDEPQIDF
ncbi:MAG: hypothetical protein MR765_02390 [Tenericutes bacterium]|nr:hypothetical protein [Mycoplasmatota bacterium]